MGDIRKSKAGVGLKMVRNSGCQGFQCGLTLCGKNQQMLFAIRRLSVQVRRLFQHDMNIRSTETQGAQTRPSWGPHRGPLAESGIDIERARVKPGVRSARCGVQTGRERLML